MTTLWAWIWEFVSPFLVGSFVAGFGFSSMVAIITIMLNTFRRV